MIMSKLYQTWQLFKGNWEDKTEKKEVERLMKGQKF